MTQRRFTHSQLVEFITELMDSQAPANLRGENILQKHKKLGVEQLLEEAWDQWESFYQIYELIKMTEMHLMYESNPEKFNKEFGENERRMLGTKILDNIPDEAKALAAMHAYHVSSQWIEPLFTEEQLHIFMHKGVLRLTEMQNDINKDWGKNQGRN